jgi:hypothetical protein
MMGIADYRFQFAGYSTIYTEIQLGNPSPIRGEVRRGASVVPSVPDNAPTLLTRMSVKLPLMGREITVFYCHFSKSCYYAPASRKRKRRRLSLPTECFFVPAIWHESSISGVQKNIILARGIFCTRFFFRVF